MLSCNEVDKRIFSNPKGCRLRHGFLLQKRFENLNRRKVMDAIERKSKTSSGNPPLLASTRKYIIDWMSINWKKAERIVRQLQTRIVKAKRAGKIGLVRRLTFYLVHSFSAKVLAIRRVTGNKGKKTSGVDGILWNTPEKKTSAILQVGRKKYKASPLKRVYIPKSNGKTRPLGIPTMLDRAKQALYLMALDPVAEVQADRNSYGFRRERTAHDAIEQCFKCLTRKNSPQWIFEGDIKGCFDNIRHKWLLENIPMNKSILQKWLQAGYIEKCHSYTTTSGTPQGGIISPALSNMTLDGMEEELNKIKSGEQKKIHLIRYADDFIITGTSKEVLEKEVKPLIREFLHQRGLTLSQEKTKITHIDEGFDFLGHNIRKYNNKLLIKPSKKSIKSLLSNIREVFHNNKTTKTENLIRLINPIIRGWVYYYRHVVSKDIFSYIDSEIWTLTWKWANRRHPNKSKRWVKNKYYARRGNEEWILGNGQISLFQAHKVKIKRHTKIRGEAIPYDPTFYEYFDKRHEKKWNELSNQKQRMLLIKQEGKCSYCKIRFEELSELNCHVHHIIPRSKGGTDALRNLSLLHPECHQQLHSIIKSEEMNEKENRTKRTLGKAFESLLNLLGRKDKETERGSVPESITVCEDF
jgi:RNA-directed DNA polymerase